MYRISESDYAETFIVKGATLFAAWEGGVPHRPTKDLDLLGRGDPNEERIEDVFRTVAATDVEPDGLVFDAASIVTQPIKAETKYEGTRAVVQGKLGTAKIVVSIDVGFGDAVTPGPVSLTFPTLLPTTPAPQLAAYPEETVIAEKLQALTELGRRNTRMKDFYDLRWLSKRRALDGRGLARAIQATFARRGTSLPTRAPDGLTDGFGLDPVKQAQWAAFVRKSRLVGTPGRLLDVVQGLRGFLEPVLQAATGGPPPSRWEPGSGWAIERKARGFSGDRPEPDDFDFGR